MHWFLLAIIAPVLWALVNICDQYLVDKYGSGKKNPGALILFSSFIGVIIALLIGIFVPHIFDISILDKLLLLLTGVFTILWVILYIYAIRIETVSGIVPWFVTVPIFGYILGYLFLGEDLALYQKIGSFIVIFGTFILSIDLSKVGKISFKKRIIFYMIPACVLLAIIGVIFKYVTTAEDFWVSSFWVHAGLGLSGIFIYLFSKNYRESFHVMLQSGGKKIFGLNLISEFVSVLGNLISSYATLLAPIALVLMVSNFQPAILLIFTVFGTKFFPSIIKENLSKRVLIPKIIAIIIMVLGSMLLFI